MYIVICIMTVLRRFTVLRLPRRFPFVRYGWVFVPVSRITDYSKSYKLRKIFVKFLEGEDLWTRRNGLDFGGDLDEIKYFSRITLRKGHYSDAC